MTCGCTSSPACSTSRRESTALTDTVKTLRKAHHECMGITIVGEDPATTVLRWDGKEGGMMVQYDAWYSKISRLTLDGAGKAGVALAYGDAFSTYNETSDMVFQDAGVGMSMATGHGGQAENEVLRCTFRRCRRGITDQQLQLHGHLVLALPLRGLRPRPVQQRRQLPRLPVPVPPLPGGRHRQP